MTSLSLLTVLAALGVLAFFGTQEDDGVDDRVGSGDTEGDDGDNDLTSAVGDRNLIGKGGDDDLLSLGGDDVLYGGDGNDTLASFDATGELGVDTLFGGAGDDVVWGENADILHGGSGVDFFFAGQLPERDLDFSTRTSVSSAGLDFLEAPQIAASTITDFDPATETLVLNVANSITIPAGSVVLEATEDGTGVRAGIQSPSTISFGGPVIWLAIVDNVTVDEMEAAKSDGRVLAYI